MRTTTISGKANWGVLAVAMLLALVLPANATTLTWDADTGTAGIQNGTGNWVNGGNNWQSGGVNVAWNNATPDTATIGVSGGTAGTITLTGPITVDDMNFNAVGSGNYTVTGDTITLAGVGTPTITTNINATINSKLSGSAGLTKSGTALLTFGAGGGNDYTGTTLINNGVLNIQDNTALGAAGAGNSTTVANGFALELQNSITVTGELLTLRGQGITPTNAGSLRSISGNNTWTGTITADLLSTVLPTSNPTDVTRIASDAGNLLISGDINITAGTLTNAVSVGVQGNGTGTISGNITGGTAGVQTFFRSGAGTGNWTLSGTNTYLGSTAINSALTVSGGAALPDTTLVAMNTNSGVLALTNSETIGSLISGNTFTAASITLGSNTLTVGADNSTPNDPFLNGAAGAFWGVISGSSGKLTKTGTGTLTLAGTNTYTGVTTINDGILQIGANSTTGSIATASNIVINSPGQLVVNRSNALTMSNAISGDGQLVKNNATGTLVLSGSTGNTYTGLTTVNAGTLDLNKTTGNAVGGDLLIQSGGKLLYGGGTTLRSNQIADTANISMTGSTSEFNYSPNSNNLGVVETFGSLTVTGGKFAAGGASNWTVTGAASFTGGAGNTIFVGNSSSRMTFGSLTITGMNATTGEGNPVNGFALFGNQTTLQSSITVGSGGLFLDGSNFYVRKGVAASTLGSKLVLNGNVTTTGTAASSISHDPNGVGLTVGTIAVELSSTAGAASRTFTIGSGGANLSVSVPITNGAATPGSIVKAGLGTLNLTGVNTYTGTTTVNAGTLLVNGSTAVGSAVTVGANGTLGGTGTIFGATNILGHHTPGNSPGIQTFNSNLTYSGGASTVTWELNNNTTTNAANPNAVFDTIIVNGNLDFAGLTTLDVKFNASGSTVLFSNSFWQTSHLGTAGWLLYDVAGTTSNLANLTISQVYGLDSAGYELAFSYFTLFQNGSDVYLNYVFVPIPEPSSMVLLGAGAVLVLRRRRRENSAVA